MNIKSIIVTIASWLVIFSILLYMLSTPIHPIVSNPGLVPAVKVDVGSDSAYYHVPSTVVTKEVKK